MRGSCLRSSPGISAMRGKSPVSRLLRASAVLLGSGVFSVPQPTRRGRAPIQDWSRYPRRKTSEECAELVAPGADAVTGGPVSGRAPVKSNRLPSRALRAGYSVQFGLGRSRVCGGRAASWPSRPALIFVSSGSTWRPVSQRKYLSVAESYHRGRDEEFLQHPCVERPEADLGWGRGESHRQRETT